MRHRNGNNAISTWKFANAHDVAGFNTTNGGTEVRAYSPFPLGMRISASIPAGQNAPIYQAPRISVVDDLNFYAGTKVDYTDASIGISSTTPFVVSEVRWSAHERQHDKITLVLEKDESKALSGLASYIIPEINKGRTPATTPAAPTPSPSRGGGGGSRGGGGYYPSPSPPFQGPIGTLPSVPSDIPIGVRQVNGSGPADAISGQMQQLNNVGVNNASEDLLKRIKGNMDLHTQFGMKDGDFSILGQKNPGQTPIQSMGVGGVGLVWDKRRNAVFTSEGAVFPGVSTNTDTDVGHTAIHSLTVGVPENVVGKKINVDATVNFDADTDEGAILKFTVQCLETNASSTIDVPIYYSMSNDSQRLITTEIEGAQTPGNTIKITIQRQVNTGNDDAKYSAVLLKNLDVKFIQSTFTGRSDSYRFLGFKNNGVRNL